MANKTKAKDSTLVVLSCHARVSKAYLSRVAKWNKMPSFIANFAGFGKIYSLSLHKTWSLGYPLSNS